MVEEELQTMNIRCFERAMVVQELFEAYTRTVAMLVDYTVQLYDGELDLKASGYQTSFSPGSALSSA